MIFLYVYVFFLIVCFFVMCFCLFFLISCKLWVKEVCWYLGIRLKLVWVKLLEVVMVYWLCVLCRLFIWGVWRDIFYFYFCCKKVLMWFFLVVWIVVELRWWCEVWWEKWWILLLDFSVGLFLRILLKWNLCLIMWLCR